MIEIRIIFMVKSKIEIRQVNKVHSHGSRKISLAGFGYYDQKRWQLVDHIPPKIN